MQALRKHQFQFPLVVLTVDFAPFILIILFTDFQLSPSLQLQPLSLCIMRFYFKRWRITQTAEVCSILKGNYGIFKYGQVLRHVLVFK